MDVVSWVVETFGHKVVYVPHIHPSTFKKKQQTHTIENTRQASDWTPVHFGAISLSVQASFWEPGHYEGGAWETVHDGVSFGQAPPLRDYCQEIKLRPCDISDNPDHFGLACNRKNKQEKKSVSGCETLLN